MTTETGDPEQTLVPAAEAGEGSTAHRGLLGQLLLREGLITPDQLDAALRFQESHGTRVPLGQILVQQQVLTQWQVNSVLDRYHKKYRLGDILVETEMVTEDQLRIALDHQRRSGLRLGDALLQLNFLTEELLAKALCTQFGITFLDLDRLILDRDVASLVARDYAELHRVIPITRSDGVLVLAMDDPSDLRVVRELETTLGVRVNPVTSTQAAFRRAFVRAYGESPDGGLVRQYEHLRRTHEGQRQELVDTRARLADVEETHRALVSQHGDVTDRILDLIRRADDTGQALADLTARHEAAEGRHLATTEALDSLRGRHEAAGAEIGRLQVERDALLEAVGEARRQGAALEATLADERRDWEDFERSLRDAQARDRDAAQALAGRQCALEEEHAALADEHRRVQARHATDLASLIQLEADHAALADERSGLVAELERLAEQLQAAQAGKRDLEASRDEACRARDEQAAAAAAGREALEEFRRAHQVLAEAQDREREKARALQVRHDDLLRQRQEAAEALRTVLDRLG